MEQTSVQRLARVLRMLVSVIFVCNILALLVVPLLALAAPEAVRGPRRIFHTHILLKNDK